MSLKSKKSSLADKINSLITAAPDNLGSDDEAEETRARVVERYEESDSDGPGASSSIRKQNIDLLDEVDERYKGKKVSRKDLYGDESSEDSDDSPVEQNSSESDNQNSESGSEAPEDAGDSEEDSEAPEDAEEDSEAPEEASEDAESSSEDSEVDEDNPLRRNRDPTKTFSTATSNNLHSDIEKGHAVREQLKLWEHILEMRIQLQKCLVTSNRLPQYNSIDKFTPDKQFVKTKTETTKQLTNLLENLLQVQEKLLKNNPETKNLSSKKEKNEEKNEEEDPMDEEIPSDTDEEEKEEDDDDDDDEDDEEEEKNSEQPPKKKRRTLNEYEKLLSTNHNNIKSYRDSVIQKWNDKTRLASGNATKGSTQSVVKQIEFLLNDKSKLIKRTQLKRSEYKIAGKDPVEATDEDGRRTQEYDPEIYDDDDFYHQLLRELIEQKSADITDPVQLSKQWIQLQNMRNKMKRKIDTRATKGRRIRYNVHAKLVNFMAPITVDDNWSDLAKSELFNSLFGRIKGSMTDNNQSTTS